MSDRRPEVVVFTVSLANWGRWFARAYSPGLSRLAARLRLACRRGLPGALEHLLEHLVHVVGVDELDVPRGGLALISATSASLRSGRKMRVMPAARAASTFSLMPPTGSTCPVRVTSPVMATSASTGRPDTMLARATVMATPAEGPSLGTAPAGTWTWMSCFWKNSASTPRLVGRCCGRR